MRRLAALVPLIAASPAAAAPESRLRLGAEGGIAWYNAFPDELLGPAALVRLRGQIGERFLANVALSHLRQPLDGGQQNSTLIPITLDVRLDRAPVAPYIGGGAALVHVDGVGWDFGAVFEAGLEWSFTERWALTGQASYPGHQQAAVFPYLSSLTFGLTASIL